MFVNLNDKVRIITESRTTNPNPFFGNRVTNNKALRILKSKASLRQIGTTTSKTSNNTEKPYSN